MIRQEIEKYTFGELHKSGPETGSQRFRPTIDFIGFSGHFPDFPILPAMLQILFGVIVTEKILATKLVLKKLDKAKFMLQIKPDEIITVTCKTSHSPPESQEHAIKSKVTIMVAEQRAATMTLFLEAI
ncbi:hypothetical protein KAI46_11505 [bacterium]|nr:hypothetical protein [bacterium]